MNEKAGLLELLGVHEREVSISRLLCAAAARSPEVLNALLGMPHEEVRGPVVSAVELGFAVKSRKGAKRRADFALAWQDSEGPSVLVVEHKLYACESEDQTADYVAAWEQFVQWGQAALAHAGGSAGRRPCRVHFRLLSLLGDVPRDPSFRAVRHVELITALRALDPHGPIGALAHDWAGLVEQHQRETARIDGPITLDEAFVTPPGAGLDARFSRFERFVAQICSGAGMPLERHGLFRSSYDGRAFFGAHITVPGLYGEFASNLGRGTPEDPSRDWWLHFQVRLHVEPGPARIELGLFCETLPYVTRKQFQKCGNADQRDHYLQMRARLVSLLRDAVQQRDERLTGWVTGGHWCKVATLRHTWSGGDLAVEVAARLAAEIEAVRVPLLRLQADLLSERSWQGGSGLEAMAG